MSFKIRKTEIEISFTFFALFLLFISSNNYKSYLITVCCGLMHEIIHLCFIYKFSCAPKRISFTLFGANIIRDNSVILKNFEEFAINVSAPLFNLFVGFLFNFLSKKTNEVFSDFTVINIVMGIFNLLPFYNFDGGNALRSLLILRLNDSTAEKILTVTSVIVTVLFSIMTFIVFIKYENNYSLIIISVYFLLTLIFKR